MAAEAMTAGTNQAATTSTRRWMGARLRCASATMCTIRDSMVSAPIFSASDHERAGPVDRAADHFGSGRLFDRHRLAGHHRFIDCACSLGHGAIHGNCFARSNPQPIAHADLIERHFLIGAVRPDAPRRLGCQFQERPNGAAGLLARTQLEDLTQQHENRDHRGGFVVDRDQAAVLDEGPRGISAGAKVATKLYK